MTDMRALTVRQPWAAAIMWGGKTVENRPRPVRYRGRIWIHAGHSQPVYRDVEDAFWCAAMNTYAPSPEHYPVPWALLHRTGTLGHVLGSAEVIGCHPAGDCNHICPEPEDWNPDTDLPCEDHEGPCRNHCSHWAWPDQWHWQLAEIRPLARPVRCKGKLGLWRLPRDVEAAVMTASAETWKGRDGG